MTTFRNIHTNEIITVEVIETVNGPRSNSYTVKLAGTVQKISSFQGWAVVK